MICKIPSSKSHEYETVCLWIANLVKRVAEEAVPEVKACNKTVEAPGAVEEEEKSSRFVPLRIHFKSSTKDGCLKHSADVNSQEVSERILESSSYGQYIVHRTHQSS